MLNGDAACCKAFDILARPTRAASSSPRPAATSRSDTVWTPNDVSLYTIDGHQRRRATTAPATTINVLGQTIDLDANDRPRRRQRRQHRQPNGTNDLEIDSLARRHRGRQPRGRRLDLRHRGRRQGTHRSTSACARSSTSPVTETDAVQHAPPGARPRLDGDIRMTVRERSTASARTTTWSCSDGASFQRTTERTTAGPRRSRTARSSPASGSVLAAGRRRRRPPPEQPDPGRRSDRHLRRRHAH